MYLEDDMLTLDDMWEILMEYAGVSEETLQVVTSINGYSTETMYDILYAVTGFRSFEQYDDDLEGALTEYYGKPEEDEEE